MRRYDDPVEVRRGAQEAPEQFLWHGRLWRVRSVLAHWVETGAWWTGGEVRSVIGSDDARDSTGSAGAALAPPDLLAERDVWRVEAARGAQDPGGVLDLAFDWGDGGWRLVGCLD
jgi:hypothetical protein